MSRAGRPRHATRRPVPGIALASAALATVALSGCGGPEPLAKFTPTQQSQFDAAWTAVINATDTADLTELDRASRAKTLYAACKPLDRSNALLSALADACRPLYVSKKLDAILPTRCASPSAVCMRSLDRAQSTITVLATQLANVNAQAKLLITQPKCLAEVITTPARIDAYGKLAAAYGVMSLGVQRKDEDITTLGQHQIDDANTVIADNRGAAQRMAAFRTECGIKQL